jgi:hypothetical protein
MSAIMFVGSILVMIGVSFWLGWIARSLYQRHLDARAGYLRRAIVDAERGIARSFLGAGGTVKW